VLDVLIRGGHVIDGSGAPAFAADVAIADGRIAAAGTVDEPAARVIEAEGPRSRLACQAASSGRGGTPLSAGHRREDQRMSQNEFIQPDGIARPSFPYTPVVVSGDLVVTAGQVANDPSGNVVSDDIEAQTRQVLDNIRACLAGAGCGLEDVIKVNAFLTDLGNFAVYNAVYREYFSEPYPARTTVGAALAPGLHVEVEVIARRPS
jgi:2-iminobutanoate/2-iminopropanoate deaminase